MERQMFCKRQFPMPSAATLVADCSRYQRLILHAGWPGWLIVVRPKRSQQRLPGGTHLGRSNDFFKMSDKEMQLGVGCSTASKASTAIADDTVAAVFTCLSRLRFSRWCPSLHNGTSICCHRPAFQCCMVVGSLPVTVALHAVAICSHVFMSTCLQLCSAIASRSPPGMIDSRTELWGRKIYTRAQDVMSDCRIL